MNNIRNSLQDGGQHQQRMIEQQEKAMRQTQDKQRAMEQYETLRNDSYSTQGSVASALPSTPILDRLDALNESISNLQVATECLFKKLMSVTSAYENDPPAEPCAPKAGNSHLSIAINAMIDRIEAIEVSLQLQIKRLEV